MCILAALLILYFYVTGYDSIHLGETTINLTERTFIWQYAISHFNDAPLLGFGINGFWTRPAIYDYFNQNHGWVLDNYHSGYIAVAIETDSWISAVRRERLSVLGEGPVFDLHPVDRSRPLRSHHRICCPEFPIEFHGDDVPPLDDVHVGASGRILLCGVQAGAAAIPVVMRRNG